MKYADQPDRFMESEADLDEAVKALLVVASAPDLYPELVARWALLYFCKHWRQWLCECSPRQR